MVSVYFWARTINSSHGGFGNAFWWWLWLTTIYRLCFWMMSLNRHMLLEELNQCLSHMQYGWGENAWEAAPHVQTWSCVVHPSIPMPLFHHRTSCFYQDNNILNRRIAGAYPHRLFPSKISLVKWKSHPTARPVKLNLPFGHHFTYFLSEIQ